MVWRWPGLFFSLSLRDPPNPISLPITLFNLYVDNGVQDLPVEMSGVKRLLANF